MKFVRDKDIQLEASRSGGPGGQHANRSATAVRLRIKLGDLTVSDEERKLIREHLPPRYLTSDDELILEVEESRSQQENRDIARERAEQAIERALEEGRQERSRQQRSRRMSQTGSGGGGSGEEDLKERQKRERRAESTDDLLEQAYEEDPDTIGRFLEGTEEEEN